MFNFKITIYVKTKQNKDYMCGFFGGLLAALSIGHYYTFSIEDVTNNATPADKKANPS